MKITKEFLPKSNRNRPGHSMNPKYITVHNTANEATGANARAHAKYLLAGAGGRSVSWHYTVDDTEVYQHLPTNESGWHAGDGSGPGNRQSIGVEICENRDGDFDKAVVNAQSLIKKLMDEHHIPIGNVVPHKHWTGKNCPRHLLDTWDGFVEGIDGGKVSAASSKSEPKLTGNGKIRSIQSTLNSRYGLNIAVDGWYGPETKGALVKGLQKELNKQFGRGLAVDGKFGPKTRAACVNVRRGAKGNMTWILQSSLECVGHSPGPLDGVFGSKTEKAVRAFQREKGLAVDAIAGTNTWSKLFG